jgi:hypothetical protein
MTARGIIIRLCEALPQRSTPPKQSTHTACEIASVGQDYVGVCRKDGQPGAKPYIKTPEPKSLT